MNHSKIILVAFISAFVAITTAILGVAGTIIGSVLSSVLYNVLAEVLEKPMSKKHFETNFEHEIAYLFPLIVIALIQLLLLLAFLSEWGFLPGKFLQAYLMIQGVVENNLYRILGLGLIVMSVYPFIFKPDLIKKNHGLLIAFIGLIFLARGFVDAHNVVSELYDVIFHYFDFPIEVFAFILIVYVILSILTSVNQNRKVERPKRHIREDDLSDLKLKRISGREFSKNKNNNSSNNKVSNRNNDKCQKTKFNESADDIKFESNDLLDDYKR